jgi:hypothetical protein
MSVKEVFAGIEEIRKKQRNEERKKERYTVEAVLIAL